MNKWFIGLDMSRWGVNEVQFWNTVTKKWTAKESATEFDSSELAQASSASEEFIIISLEV